MKILIFSPPRRIIRAECRRQRRAELSGVPQWRARSAGGLILSPGEDLALASIDGTAGGVMAAVFEVLGNDHAEVKQLLAELAAPCAASGSDLAHRKKMVQRLIIEESSHEAMEEMYCWPAVRDKVTGGDKLAATAIDQEQGGHGHRPGAGRQGGT
jgi:hypothetical protein